MLFYQNYCLGPKTLVPEARMLIPRQRLRKTAVNKLLVTVDRWQFSPRGEKNGRCKLHQCMRLKAKVSRYEHRVQFQVDTYTLLTVDIPPPSVPTLAVHTPRSSPRVSPCSISTASPISLLYQVSHITTFSHQYSSAAQTAGVVSTVNIDSH
jgi:hypothetical protein